LIPRDQIEKLQNSVNIVDVIGERIDIRRAGSNFKARCPFHDEKTASFMISDSKQIFKCFGCGVSGDSIKFVMMYDNLSYPDAIRNLASRYGIEIKEEFDGTRPDRTEDDKKELIRILNGHACDLFHEDLLKEIRREGSSVAAYLKKRKIKSEFITKFKLGFAREEWHTLKEDSRFSGYKDDILIEAGLRKMNEKGNVYDQFRNRLIFPIFDQLGNVLAFSGRALDDEVQPKYLNSPETVLYRKNQVLYGLYQAMESIRRSKAMILVEGNIDLITMHRYGYTNTVAICGTAFTENHALIVKRNADRIMLMLDGDGAGRKSSVKTAEILISAGMNPSIALLGEEYDPDTFLNEFGQDKMNELLKSQISLIGLLLHDYDRSNKNANVKMSFINKVLASLSNISNISESQAESLLQEAQTVLNIDSKIMKNDFRKLKNSKNHSEKQPDKKTVITGNYLPEKEDITEFTLLYLMLSDDDARNKILSEITEEDFHNKEAARVFLKIYELYEEGEPVKLNKILIDFDEKFKDFMIGFVISQENIFSADFEKSGSSVPDSRIMIACEDSLKKISLRKISDRIRNMNEELKYTDDIGRQNEILQTISDLKQKQIEITAK